MGERREEQAELVGERAVVEQGRGLDEYSERGQARAEVTDRPESLDDQLLDQRRVRPRGHPRPHPRRRARGVDTVAAAKRGRIDDSIDHRPHLTEAALDPPDSEQVPAVVPERIGIAGLFPENQNVARQALGLFELAATEGTHDVEDGGDVADGSPRQSTRLLTQIDERALGPHVAGQVEIDRAPAEAEQREDAPLGSGGGVEQFLGDLEPPVGVRGGEECVVIQRQRLGGRRWNTESADVIDRDSDGVDRFAVVGSLSGETDAKDCRQARARQDRGW